MARAPKASADGVDAVFQARRSRWPARIDVGRVVKPHGVRGEVALDIWGELGESVRRGASVFVGGRSLEVLGLRGAGDRVIARFDGVDGRDAAEDLRGEILRVSSDGLSIPPDDQEYLFELEGCLIEVEHDDAVVELGEVRRVIEDGGGLLLEVTGHHAASDGTQDPEVLQYLIPYVTAYLRHKDLTRGILRFSLPEGLLETCVSTS